VARTPAVAVFQKAACRDLRAVPSDFVENTAVRIAFCRWAGGVGIGCEFA
jgi:hypothetical protein